ncbi:MAG: tRNA 2-selenouridine(34) synthase MnmH [bacterium]
MQLRNLSNVSNIDLRSENEFKKGSIPQSVNIPILNNDQFKKVGIEYKKNGSDAAIALGHSLVKGSLKENLIHHWTEHLKKNPECLLYCFRGGMRSEIAVKWLSECGVKVNRLKGGYKNFRNWVISQHLDIENYIKDWIIIGGLTGSGKTDFLRSFKESIDLEQIANHRGSAFGVRDSGQPTQSNFENILTLDYLNHKYEKLILEDESRTIGRAGLPGFWYQKMQSSKLIILEVDDDKRAENIYYEYVYDELNNGVNEDILLEKYLGSLNNIKRRLGNVVYNNIKDLMKSAFRQNEKEIHKEWILTLLTSYYDKMYSYKLDMRKDFIVHKGEIESCRDYINAIL